MLYSRMCKDAKCIRDLDLTLEKNEYFWVALKQFQIKQFLNQLIWSVQNIGFSLKQEGATYSARATSCPRDTNKSQMWPADENSCPPLA